LFYSPTRSLNNDVIDYVLLGHPDSDSARYVIIRDYIADFCHSQRVTDQIFDGEWYIFYGNWMHGPCIARITQRACGCHISSRHKCQTASLRSAYWRDDAGFLMFHNQIQFMRKIAVQPAWRRGLMTDFPDLDIDADITRVAGVTHI
jgi:hypothetical protein